MSILLAVERHTPCTLHVHIPGCENGYTLHINSVGYGKGHTLYVPTDVVERYTPCTSILLAVEMDISCTSMMQAVEWIHPAYPYC